MAIFFENSEKPKQDRKYPSCCLVFVWGCRGGGAGGIGEVQKNFIWHYWKWKWKHFVEKWPHCQQCCRFGRIQVTLPNTCIIIKMFSYY